MPAVPVASGPESSLQVFLFSTIPDRAARFWFTSQTQNGQESGTHMQDLIYSESIYIQELKIVACRLVCMPAFNLCQSMNGELTAGELISLPDTYLLWLYPACSEPFVLNKFGFVKGNWKAKEKKN